MGYFFSSPRNSGFDNKNILFQSQRNARSDSTVYFTLHISLNAKTTFMQPAGFTNITFVNATNQSIIVGPNGGGNWINNTYQMCQWFNTTPGTLLVQAQSANSYELQFLSGVGDEDDAADEVFSFGNTPNTQAIHFMARTTSGSAHYFGFEIGSNFSYPMVIGVNLNADWNTPINPTQISWYGYNSDNISSASNIGFVNNGNGTFIIVDLSALFVTQALINQYYYDILDNSLDQSQQIFLFNSVQSFVSQSDEEKQYRNRKLTLANPSLIVQNLSNYSYNIGIYLPNLLLLSDNFISKFSGSVTLNLTSDDAVALKYANFFYVAAFIMDGSEMPPRLTISTLPSVLALSGNYSVDFSFGPLGLSVGGGKTFNDQDLYAEPLAVGVIRANDYVTNPTTTITLTYDELSGCKLIWEGGANPNTFINTSQKK